MDCKRLKKAAKRGFTLIELLVVIVIIGILASGVFMMTRAGNSESARAKTIEQVHAIATLLEEYKAIFGDYPLVSDADENGYANLNFTFIANHASCSECGAQNVSYRQGSDCRADGVAFGLVSHFLPRVQTIMSNTRGTNMNEYYRDQLKNPSEGSVWEKEYRTGLDNDSDKAIDNLVDYEARDVNLQQIYRSWRRLVKQGLVYDGMAGCDYCEVLRYIAGAYADGWGHGLKYRNEGGAGEIVSAGPDGKFGNSDDITSGGAAFEDDE